MPKWLVPALRIVVQLAVAAWQAYGRGRADAIKEQDKADAETIAKADAARAAVDATDVQHDKYNRDAS